MSSGFFMPIFEPMKVLTIVGARPQFIKAAALSHQIRQKFAEVLVHTGQHFDEAMSKVFFTEMEIPEPDYHLGINSLGHGAMTGRMLEKLEELMIAEKPDWVLVYGDTNSTLAGALAARKLQIKLAHVEAGLRSFDDRMPEEINRVLTDRMSDLLFVPSQVARQNLLKEGIPDDKIIITGDIMYDAVLHFSQKIPPARKLNEPYVLLTLHRQENTDNPEKLRAWVEAINDLAASVKVVCPVHPRTAQRLRDNQLELKVDKIEPQGYLQMLALIRDCEMVLTDSGGLQKEAFYLGKKCITLRDNTEWTELLDLGVNMLCDPGQLQLRYRLLEQKEMPDHSYPYGKGDTAGHIINALVQD